MNEVVEEGLKGISAFELVCWILAGVTLLTVIVTATIKIYKAIEKYRVVRNAHDKKIEMISQHENDIKELKETDKTLITTLNDLSEKVDGLSDKLTEMQNHDKLDAMHQAQDRIMQMFRFYVNPNRVNEAGHNYWTNVERDTYNNMYESYIRNGGNSHVKDYVHPKMMELDVVDVWQHP